MPLGEPSRTLLRERSLDLRELPKEVVEPSWGRRSAEPLRKRFEMDRAREPAPVFDEEALPRLAVTGAVTTAVVGSPAELDEEEKSRWPRSVRDVLRVVVRDSGDDSVGVGASAIPAALPSGLECERAVPGREARSGTGGISAVSVADRPIGPRGWRARFG